MEEQKKELEELCMKLKARKRGVLPPKKWIKTEKGDI